MKKITALLLILALSLCFSFSAFAETDSADSSIGQFDENSSGNRSFMYDPNKVLHDVEADVLFRNLTELVEKAGYDAGIIFAEKNAEISDPVSYAGETFSGVLGSDYVGLLFVTGEEEKTSWLCVSGICSELYTADCASLIHNSAQEFIEKDDFYGAALAAVFTAQNLIVSDYDCSGFPEELTAPVENRVVEAVGQQPETENTDTTEDAPAPVTGADGRYKEEIGGHFALLHNLDKTLSKTEEEAVFEKLREVVGKQKFSVCVLISSDIGPSKSDRSAVDYADVYYEKECGMNTDGILLLMNNDTEYDWISTSGRCEKIFTDRKIDRLFDYFYSYLEKGNHYKAALGFCEAVDKCASGDSYFSKTGSGTTSYVDEDIDIDPGVVFFFLIIIVIVEICVVSSVLNGYKLKAVKGASPYMVKSSLVFSEKDDKFIRTYVTHHTVSSSSSGGGGHHSSGHHSSGGGHHGGGGRHR